MKKINIRLLFVSSLVTLLPACATLANLELQKKPLANGNTAYIDYNLAPTQNWGCKQIDYPQYYNWQALKMSGQFTLEGGRGLLADKAIAYANQMNLNPNYINLQIPEEQTSSTSAGRLTHYTSLNPNAQAIVSYYQCTVINPDHKIGWVQKNNVSFQLSNSN